MPVTEKPRPESEAMTLPEAPPAPRISIEQLLSVPDSDDRRRWINAIVQNEIDRNAYRYDLSLARQFALAGVLDDIKGTTLEQAAAQCFLKIRTGRDLGLSATDSIQSIYFASSGKPSLQNDIFASKLQEAGFSWTPEWEEKDGKTVRCTLWLLKRNPLTREYEPVLYAEGKEKGKPIHESFGVEDARTAKIWEKGAVKTLIEKWNFQSWPRNMFYWRAMSRLRQFHFPQILRGVIPLEERFDVLREPETAERGKWEKLRAEIIDTKAEPAGEKEA